MNVVTQKISVLLLLSGLVGCSLPQEVQLAPEEEQEEEVEEEVVPEIDSGTEMVTEPIDSGVAPVVPALDAGVQEVLIIDAGYEPESCDAGFNDDGSGCENIDDCADIDCGNGECIDLVNGAMCDCANGYQDNDGNHTCELACGTVDCLQFWTCDDSSGSADCVCGAGAEMVAASCEPILCQANEYVSGHACLPCATGTLNALGDSAYGEDTTCDEECLEDEHCGGRDVCNFNNECVDACENHQECIDLYINSGETANSDYACVEGHCVGVLEGMCYVTDHCLNDGDLSVCAGSDAAQGACVECLNTSDCGPESRCNQNNICEDRNFVCTTHQNCIDEWGDSDGTYSYEYGCFDGTCAGMTAGRCFIQVHCENDGELSYCDGDENREGDCVECLQNDHCEANEVCNALSACEPRVDGCSAHSECNANGDSRDENGACVDGLCVSMGLGRCFIDSHCNDDTHDNSADGIPTTVCSGAAGNDAGNCVQCLVATDCIAVFGAPTDASTYVCTSNNLCVNQAGSDD